MFEHILDTLAAKGHFCFDIPELVAESGKSEVAVRNALMRLKKAAKVAMPVKGYYVVVPPEYRSIGCLPSDHFIPDFMGRVNAPYYVGLLSAAEYSGAAHQRPQEFQVVVDKVRRPIKCGKVRVRFVVRNNASDIPAFNRNTPRGLIKVSTPEATAFDLVGYPNQSGGLDNAATVLVALEEKMNSEALVEVAKLSPLAWSQRLGYLLEFIEKGKMAAPLLNYVREKNPVYSALIAGKPVKGTERDSRWRLFVNGAVEVDT